MTDRVSYQPQDFLKKCNQAERDHESRKLELLLDRVKRQIAERANPNARAEAPKPPVMAIAKGSMGSNRTALFER